MSDQWLSVEDIARELKVPEDTVRAWIRNKKLPAYRPGREYRVKQSDLEKFLADSRTMEDDANK